MSYVIMTVPVRIHPGCLLLWGKTEKKETVEFLRYAEMRVGPLNVEGRRPGRYADRNSLVIRIPGGKEKTVPTSDIRFVDTYPRPIAADIPSGFSVDERLGDLPHEIRLWPGDTVRFMGRKINGPWTVEGVDVGPSSVFGGTYDEPMYDLTSEHGSMSFGYDGGDSIMITRGNVYHLYHDHDTNQMKFASDQEELAFWTQEGVSVCGLGRGGSGQPLWPCADFFRKGYVDLIAQTTNGVWYRTYKLHDIFAKHRKYVRAFTERLYGMQMEVEIACVAEAARRRELSGSA